MDPKGYETKPWWPYVKNLQDQISGGGSGGGDIVFCPFTDEAINIGPTSGYISTMTFAEIKQVLDSGKVVLTRYPDATGLNYRIFAFVTRPIDYGGQPGGIMLEGRVQAEYIPESISEEYAGYVIIRAK